MTDYANITPELVRQALDYNPNTGEYIWKNRPQSHFINSRSMSSWNARYAGTQAGKRTSEGRLTIFLMKRPYLAYRLAFVIMTGEWPTKYIDHIDGDATNDKWNNLRLATHQQNLWNTGKKKHNKSGFKGVIIRKNLKYQASVMINRKRKHLGTYATPEEAYAAYCKAAVDMHGEYHRLA